jgi:hypothetical protein
MPVTSNDIANQALQMVGGNTPAVVGIAPNFDDSTAGKALRWLYDAVVGAVARQFEWDFARKTAALVLTGNPAPVPWAFEYTYPAGCAEVWQLLPTVTVDANDPLPVNFVIANNVVAGSQVRVIHANLASASVVYNSNPNENAWDSEFRMAVVDLLGRCLALAIEGKPDLSMALLNSAGGFAQAGQRRQG